MGKALIFSDLHVHAHKDRVDRLYHCLEVLEWAFATAEKRDCKYIWFLGDLFHERSKIDMLNYLKTFEIFIKHMGEATDRDMYLLVGNHDMYHKERWDVNSVKPLTAIPRVHIIEKPTRMMVEGKRIDWMPHTDNPIKVLEDFKQAEGGAGDLLLGHAAVHGAALNMCYGTRADVIVEYDNDMVPVSPDVFQDWPMTLLGHYHGAQKLSHNVEYVGSPHQLTYGEAFQTKHCIVLDLETMEKEYVVNTFSPVHIILKPQDVLNESYNLNGNFVRLTIESQKKKEFVEIKKHIAQNYKVLSLDSKGVEKKKDEDQTVITDAKAIMLDTQAMLKAYIKEKGVPAGLDEPRLLVAGSKCLEKKTSS
jgi:DNA repair exonuclease SbcCD nuclease subunit